MKRKPAKPDQNDFYVNLAVRVLRDQAALCSIRSSSIALDESRILERVSVEGLSFLTKTLPALGKCLDKALSSGCPFPKGHAFKLSKRAPFLPVFLRGFWELVFDKDGLVAEFDDVGDALRQIRAVRAIRQVCYLLYKLDVPHSDSASAAVIDKFVETDGSLPEEMAEVPLSPEAQRAIDNARVLIAFVLRRFNPTEIHPGHGPGAVSTGEKPWEKMKFSRFYVKLDELYPYSDYFFFNYTHLVDEMEVLDLLVEEVPTAKVTLVPKDSRGPRLISMEPLEIQWIQQGVMRELFKTIEDPNNLTAGYVNFTDQTVNRDLALANSYDGYMCTLDMEEASDRVSLWLVRQLFPPHVYKHLCACRSEQTELPGGTLLRLKKFAPMGSSCCFPVEALIFWALAVGTVMKAIPWTIRNLRIPEVYVFGDDIIARKSDYERFRPVFEELHLKFNEGKCSTGRFFRESCGLDAFKFEDVSPIRIKAQWAEKLSPAASASYVSYCNSLQGRGCIEASAWLRSRVEQKLGPVPRTNDTRRSLFAFVESEWTDQEVLSYLLSTYKSRYNKRYMRWEVKIKTLQPVYFKTGEPGWLELLRMSAQIGSSNQSVLPQTRTLEPCRYAVPRQLKTRWRWVATESLLTQG
jgi:hypothetical protein